MEETVNPEATYTACRIIYAIIESIIFEEEQFELSNEFIHQLPSLLNKNIHWSKGLQITIFEHYMEIKIYLILVRKDVNLIREIALLQKKIIDEVYHLVGIRINKVNVVINKYSEK